MTPGGIGKSVIQTEFVLNGSFQYNKIHFGGQKIVIISEFHISGVILSGLPCTTTYIPIMKGIRSKPNKDSLRIGNDIEITFLGMTMPPKPPGLIGMTGKVVESNVIDDRFVP